MKIEADRSNFLKAWQIAEKYTVANQQRDSQNGIRIIASEDAVTLEATDLKSSVKCPVKGVAVNEDGISVLGTAFFGELLRKTTEKTITLELGDERGMFKAGKIRVRFPVMPADTFPKIPESSGAEPFCEIMASDLGKLISEGSCAASSPADFPRYMGTCLLRTSGQYLILVSTDGKRLARSQRLCVVQKEDDLVLPAPALREIAKNFNTDDTVKILADGSTVWFILEKKELIKEESSEESNDDSEAVEENRQERIDVSEFALQKIETSFPQYEKILNDELCSTVKIAKSVILPAVERVGIFAKNDSNPAKLMAITLKQEGELRFSARASNLGTTSEIVDAVVEGRPMQIGFNAVFFEDGLKAADAEELVIEFSGEESQTRILKADSADFLYMLMPIRLTPQDIVPEDDAVDFTPTVEPDDFSQANETQEAPEDSQEDFNPQEDPAPQYDDSDAPF